MKKKTWGLEGHLLAKLSAEYSTMSDLSEQNYSDEPGQTPERAIINHCQATMLWGGLLQSQRLLEHHQREISLVSGSN